MKLCEKAESIQSYIAKNEFVDVDRWGHVKFNRISDKGTKVYRYKKGKNVIRFEVQSQDGKTWFLIKSFNVNKMYDKLVEKGLL